MTGRGQQEARRSSGRIRSREGAPLLVRPIQPGDKARLARHFDDLGEESRYRRFLTPIRQLNNRDLAYFTEVDHRRHEALIALAGDGEIVGVARYIRLVDRPEAAEVAVAVADEWQGRGVGKALLALLVQRARAVDVRSFIGICLTGNRSMQHLLKELGPESRTRWLGDGTVEIEVVLPVRVDSRHIALPLRIAAGGSDRSRRARVRVGSGCG